MIITFIRKSDNEKFVFGKGLTGFSLNPEGSVLEEAPIETASYNYAQMDGGYAVNQVRRPREFNVDGILLPAEDQNMWEERQRALKFFRIREFYQAVFEANDGYTFMLDSVVLTDGADITKWRCEGVASFRLGFIALDPNAYSYNPEGEYSSSVKVHRSTATKGGRVWENSLAVWEDGLKRWTGSGTSIVTVDVDTVLPVNPVIRIQGTATNPQIVNLTTNTSITYNGAVGAGKTLEIDCYKQTATLDGANVVANVSGDWLEIVQGLNRFQFTMTGGTTTEATLLWNEVVG